MRLRSALLAASLAACSFRASGTIDGPLTPGDGSGSSHVDASPCLGGAVGHLFEVCLLETPAQMFTVNPGPLDTDHGTECAPATAYSAATDICLLVGQTVNIPMPMSAHGARPLVIVASNGMLAVGAAGEIDVSSGSGAGAAAQATCSGGTAPGAGGSSGGGGAGGSYGGAGGAGSPGDSGGSGGTAAQPGGFHGLVGGCPGQDGGGGGLDGGTGAVGGGVAWLIATQQIQLDGDVDASGAGGGGARQNNAGGGGGGAGGLIGLDAPVIAGSGNVFANGGGGGEGASNSTNGNDGSASTSATKAGKGGGGQTNAGNGGDGSFGSNLDGSPGDSASSNDGGGGGGGGAGIVKVAGGGKAPAMCSPPPT